MSDRKPMIITFKRKDDRASSQDKCEILNEATGAEVSFFSSAEFSRGPNPVSSGQDMELLGYDVNRYETPILMAMLTDDQIASLMANEDVARVEADGPVYALDLVVEGTPSPLTQTIPVGVKQVKAPDAWPTSQGEGIKVFILDTGIDSNHPDLVANLKPGKSFVTTESSTEDFHGHGTHCAGTVAAAMNNIGVVGVAPYAYVYPVKVLNSSGSGAYSQIIAGIDWVMDKKGARVISMSLGGSSAPKALGDICKAAYDDGILLVAAAGNSGPKKNSVGYPAKLPHVMAVAAVNSSDIVASFSSRGTQVEISAPGVSVLSTTKGGGYGHMSGTSMACPHVAGVAALAWGSHRGANNKQVRWLLNVFAVTVGDGNKKKYGNGRVDANTSSFYLASPPEYVI